MTLKHHVFCVFGTQLGNFRNTEDYILITLDLQAMSGSHPWLHIKITGRAFKTLLLGLYPTPVT